MGKFKKILGKLNPINAVQDSVGTKLAKVISKLPTRVVKSLSKSLRLSGKKEIDSFTIHIKNIGPDDNFLSEEFLENLIEAINNVKEPKFKISVYKKFVNTWKASKPNLIKNLTALKTNVEATENVNKEINSFWEKNKHLLGNLKQAQQNATDLESNKARLAEITSDETRVTRELTELRTQQKKMDEDFETRKNQAEEQYSRLSSDLLRMYNDEKEKKEKGRDERSEQLKHLKVLPEIKMKKSKKGYAELETRLNETGIEELEDLRQGAVTGLTRLKNYYEEQRKDTHKELSSEQTKILVVKSLKEKTPIKRNKKLQEAQKTVEKKTTLTAESVSRDISDILEYVKAYNAYVKKRKESAVTIKEGNDNDLVIQYKKLENLMNQSDKTAREYWRNLNEETKQTLTNKGLRWSTDSNYSMIMVMKVLIKYREKGRVNSDWVDPNWAAGILKYVEEYNSQLTAAVSATDYDGMESLLTGVHPHGKTVQGYDTAKRAWDNLKLYCSAHSEMDAPTHDKVTPEESVMKCLLSANDAPGKENEREAWADDVNKYVTAYNLKRQEEEKEIASLQEELNNKYLQSYPLLTGGDDVSVTELKEDHGRIYDCARAYLSLHTEKMQGPEKRKTALADLLSRLDYSTDKLNLDEILKCVPTGTYQDVTTEERNKLDRDVQSKADALKKITTEKTELVRQIEKSTDLATLRERLKIFFSVIKMRNAYIREVSKCVASALACLTEAETAAKKLLTPSGAAVETKSDCKEFGGLQDKESVLKFVHCLYNKLDNLSEEKGLTKIDEMLRRTLPDQVKKSITELSKETSVARIKC